MISTRPMVVQELVRLVGAGSCEHRGEVVPSSPRSPWSANGRADRVRRSRPCEIKAGRGRCQWARPMAGAICVRRRIAEADCRTGDAEKAHGIPPARSTNGGGGVRRGPSTSSKYVAERAAHDWLGGPGSGSSNVGETHDRVTCGGIGDVKRVP